MPHIIPSTDLRNSFAEVERMAKETKEPIYLTKNGRGSLVIMDIEAFERRCAGKNSCQYAQVALEAPEASWQEGSEGFLRELQGSVQSGGEAK